MAKKKLKNPLDISNMLEDIGCHMVRSMKELDGDYTLSTGSIGLDLILHREGVGLVPGKVVEIYGPPGTGKSSLSLMILKQALDIGLETFYFDMEGAQNKSMMESFGISVKSSDNDKGIHLVMPPNGESCLDGIKKVFINRKNAVVILDSIANCFPSSSYEEEIGKPSFKGIANILSPFAMQSRVFVRQSGGLLIMLNQQRDNLSKYGKQSKEPGGQAVKFACDIRIEMKKGEYITNSDQTRIGHVIKAKTEKNKLHIPFQETHINLIYGKGFSKGLDLLDVGLQYGLIQKSGSWLILPGDIKVQGQLAAAEAIEQSEDVQKVIIEQMKSLLAP